MGEMTIEDRPAINPEKKVNHWYLLPHDSFRLNHVDVEGNESKKVAFIPSGVRVTIEPAKKEDRFRRIKGRKDHYIGRGRILTIEEEGKEIDSLEIDESSINVRDKIEIYLPQEHTRSSVKRKKRKNFPGQSSLNEEVFKKVS